MIAFLFGAQRPWNRRKTKWISSYSITIHHHPDRQRDLPVRGAGYEPSASYACQNNLIDRVVTALYPRVELIPGRKVHVAR